MRTKPLRSLVLFATTTVTVTAAALSAQAATPRAGADAPVTDKRLAPLSSFSPLAVGPQDSFSVNAARGSRRRAEMAFPIHGRATYGEAAARFGNNRGSHIHAGQDVFATPGTSLVAIADAIVLETGGGDARGNYVLLYDRAHRRTFAYFHMERPASVRRGQQVRAGRRVGRVGCTGRCSGPHLHLEVHRGRGAGGKPSDPLPLLRRLRRG